MWQSKIMGKGLKVKRKIQRVMWEIPLITQQSKPAVIIIFAQTNKPELANNFHDKLFTPKRTSLLKAIKKCFLKTLPDLTEGLINKHIEKSMNITIGHLHMRLQGLKSTRKTTPYKYIEENLKTNVFFCDTMYAGTTQWGKFYLTYDEYLQSRPVKEMYIFT